MIKHFFKYLFLFVLGSLSYGLIEVLFREYTYPLMMVVGGIAFIGCGLINEFLSWNTPLLLQMILSSILVTILELVIGTALLQCGIRMWDYSDQWLNYRGVICPLFSFAWMWVGLLGIVIDDIVRWKIFGEEKPRYKIL